MAILFSGDFHGNADNELPLITKSNLIKRYSQELYDEIKYHIILGDGAFLWPGGEEYDFINYYELSKRLQRGYQYLYRKTALMNGGKITVL